MKKKTDNFDKFYPTKKNSAIKEQFKQEKKKWKKERSEAIEVQKKRIRMPAEAPQPISIKKKITHEDMPLNKFIAHCGVCARREAAQMVKDGKVKVNGQLVIEPGHKVSDKDEISVNGKQVYLAKNLVYILLNKPKDYLTTSSDPEGRKTVLELIHGATKERVFPIGRLDRNTTGVLVLTNDGELTQKLSHPSNEIKKIYEVKLDKPLTKADMERAAVGMELEDGFIRPDVIAYADIKDKAVIGIEIHSGRNRIVRRIFEHLGYDVRNLDRVMFAGLTKKNVDRSKWRYLNEKEVRTLKHMNTGILKDNAKKQRISEEEKAEKILQKDREKKKTRIEQNEEADRIVRADFEKKNPGIIDPQVETTIRLDKKPKNLHVKKTGKADKKLKADGTPKKQRLTKPRKTDNDRGRTDKPYRASTDRDTDRSEKPFRANTSRETDRSEKPFKANSSRDTDRSPKSYRASADRSDRPFKAGVDQSDKPYRASADRSDKPYRPTSARDSGPYEKPFRKNNNDRKPIRAEKNSQQGSAKPYRETDDSKPTKSVKLVKKKTTNKFEDGD